MIDCHTSLKLAHNEKSPNLSLQGANAMNNEAIHTKHLKMKFTTKLPHLFKTFKILNLKSTIKRDLL